MNKEKKKSKWFSFLIYFFIIVLGIFLIYFIVNQMNQRYTSIATSDMVNLVYNQEDNYDVLSFEAVQNGDETTLNVTFIDESTYQVNENGQVSGGSLSYYSTTILSEQFNNSKFGNGENANTMFDQLCAEVKASEAKYPKLVDGGYIGYNTSIYVENPVPPSMTPYPCPPESTRPSPNPHGPFPARAIRTNKSALRGLFPGHSPLYALSSS